MSGRTGGNAPRGDMGARNVNGVRNRPFLPALTSRQAGQLTPRRSRLDSPFAGRYRPPRISPPGTPHAPTFAFAPGPRLSGLHQLRGAGPEDRAGQSPI